MDTDSSSSDEAVQQQPRTYKVRTNFFEALGYREFRQRFRLTKQGVVELAIAWAIS